MATGRLTLALKITMDGFSRTTESMGKDKTPSGNEHDDGAGAGDRPSKKQKRAAAAVGLSDGEQDASPAPAGKGYGVVGEDGLTYKQRRQLRRAAERAAREAEAAAAAAAAVAGNGEAGQVPAHMCLGELLCDFCVRLSCYLGISRLPTVPFSCSTRWASGGGLPSATPAAATALPGLGPDTDMGGTSAGKKNKDKKLGKDKDKDTGGAGAANGAAASPAVPSAGAVVAAGKGNADEAARIRAVLGFSAAGGDGGGKLKLAVGFSGPPAPAVGGLQDAKHSDSVGEESEPVGKKQEEDEKAEKKSDKGKKGKKSSKKGGEEVNKVEDKNRTSEQQKKSSKKRKSQEETEEDEKEENTGPRQEGAAGATTRGATAASPPAAAGGRSADGRTAMDVAPTTTKTTDMKASKQQQPLNDGKTPFSFSFQLQADVEAETEARLARLMALDSTKDGFVPRRIWVSGLPHEFDEATVREYWSYCGEVESMHLLTFPDSGNFNGTAYITFKTQEGYEAALACKGEMLEGRALRVEKCKAAAELKGKARGASGAPGQRASGGDGGSSAADGTSGGGGGGRVAGYPVAYCGNISFEAGAEELQQLFSRAGAVPTKIRLHSDKATGRSRGFAHVHFANDEDVDKAVALDGTSFHGRKIRVSYAQPKPGET
ncbi:hypothetical protein VOLCADRAFT_90315 [Volvox carteri f. nagariensis]|uniref:RRM domain-containing protein n=1 Tax=Volvox carteri f. nagariensis TaxID=3068 RepID=D8TU20_VOLCA|nr:uncharacterized protein VOLCADRAFT_90315 [Volvox carteri f. nagariensis]EFJ49066.1 hypothetical protein VOLCADRAFT_90315 [Volvox carteri f. nagariensis]|eukprot:XP_002949963.1 hypothetical protein VOLCADRAFT_90315 [Volvox carteri f. nagariensis]